MRRLLLGLTGVLLGFLAALVTLGALLLAAVGSVTPVQAQDVVVMLAWAGLGPHAAALLWLALVPLSAAPVGVAALVGEAAGWRGPLWYPAAAGAIGAAAAGIEARGSLVVPAFLAGVAGGAVYWLVAGRSAGLRQK